MLRIALTAACFAFTASAGLAQGDPITERQNLMKQQGRATGTLSRTVRGEEAFDLAKVQDALKVYVMTADRYETLFPENSKTGGNTRAAAKIWEDAAGFKAANARFRQDASTVFAAVKDLDTLKASFGTVARNCDSCHTTYRVSR